jgi:chemotaxis protein histidine kinase CheA
MVQIIVLNAKGDVRVAKTTAFTGEPTGATVAKALRKTKPAESIGVYTVQEAMWTIWGWREGKAGTENKHELPPPLDKILLFGDAVITSDSGELSTEAWSEFLEQAFEGFEELGSESEDEADAEEDLEEEEEEEEEADEEDAEAEEEEEAEEAEEAEEDAEDAEDAEEAEEEEDADEDCYEDGDEGGSGKRRAPRRRTVTAPECRRMDMGLRARVKIPTPVGKRAPRWQTAAELQPESYQ